MQWDAPFYAALDEAVRSLAEDIGEERLEAFGDDLSDIVSEAVSKAAERTAESLAERLVADGPEMLVRRRAERGEFEERLAARWGRAFDLAEMAMVVAYEAGEAFNESHQTEAGENADLVFAALVRLHARGCRIAEEVLTLLKAGFGQAGLARWRALHEVAAVALFIKKHGQEVAERYFAHEGIEAWRAMEEYQQHVERLSYDPYTPEEMEAAQVRFESLCDKYGRRFAGPYGWAQEVLAACNPRFTRDRATISAIEADVGLNHLRPHYRMAEVVRGLVEL